MLILWYFNIYHGTKIHVGLWYFYDIPNVKKINKLNKFRNMVYEYDNQNVNYKKK